MKKNEKIAKKLINIFGFQGACQIILASVGKKPISFVDIDVTALSNERIELIKSEINQYFFELGLMYKISKRGRKNVILEWQLSNSEEIISKTYTSTEEYGLLCGYPKTAVEAFLRFQERTSDRKERGQIEFADIEFTIPKKDWTTKAIRFAIEVQPFRFSATHYLEELDFLNSWIVELEKIIPTIMRNFFKSEGFRTYWTYLPPLGI